MAPAPKRQRVFSFLTPKVADFLFYELVPSFTKDPPAFGTAHPDTTRWPNHKLVHVEQADEQGQHDKYFYLAERANQDDYNWAFSNADIGGTKFDAVTRTYITLRSGFSSTTPAMGASMPDTPTGKFSGTHVLAERKQIRSEDPKIDSLFVVEERTYVKKVTLTEIEPEESGIPNKKETTLYYRGEVVTGSSTVEALFAEPTNAYWLTDADGFGRVGEQLSEDWFAVTFGKIIDITPIYRTSVDRLRPDKFFCPQSKTTNTVVVPNATEGAPSTPTPSAGSAVEIEKNGRVQRTTTVTQSGSPLALNGTDLNSDDGLTYPTIQELVLRADVPTSGTSVDAAGRVVEYDPVDACNAVKVTRQAVSLEDRFLKTASKMRPDKFILGGLMKSVTETETGVTSEPDQPSAVTATAVTVDQKGAIRTTKTDTQLGDLKTLPGTDLSNDDGYLYPVTQEVVDLTSVPLIRQSIQTDGRFVSYSPVDANFAIKTTGQAVSLEPAYSLETNKLAPEKFFRTLQKTMTTTTQSGVITPPSSPTSALFASQAVEQKGAVRKIVSVSQTTSPSPLKGTNLEPRVGVGYVETTEIVSSDTVVQTGVQSDGTLITFSPVDANFSTKTTTRIASTEVRTWTEVVNYEWPNVLLGISFKTWQAKNGRGSVIYPVPRYKQGYTGPQLATVTQYWSATQPPTVTPPNLVATGIQYQCPLYSISIPPCLHSTFVLSCTIGTSDPDWESATDSETFPATTYTDWPTSVFWRESKPDRGGYLVTEWTLQAPT